MKLSALLLLGPPWTFTRTKMMRRLRTRPLPKRVQLYHLVLILSLELSIDRTLTVESFAAPQNVIELPDDDEDVPQKTTGRKGRTSSRRVPTRKAPYSTSVPELVIQQSGDPIRASVSFADPVSTDRPSASTAQVLAPSMQLHASDPFAAPSVPPTPLFVTHHVPEDQVSAAKEAIRQAGVMMEQVKAIRDASQAAYDASSALQSNVQVS